jgi:putative Mg2+ transporter-C (MgtC) family protein
MGIVPITASDVALRLSLAVAAGLIVGYERESHGRAAGLRTTLLVCVSAALAMLISGHLYAEGAAQNATWRPDPGRMAQGILAGMGFLGAGAIIKEGNLIRGVTTAAVLWFVTILGLAFGSGYVLLGVAGSVIAVVTLVVLPTFEARIPNDWYGVITVTVERSAPSTDDEIRRRVEAAGASVKKMDVEEDLQTATRVIRCEVKYKKGDVFGLSAKVRGAVRTVPGVVHIKWA